jgi:D-beta-D-heptose 7-phosphate kinase/D-beta-D-heptose 1-phosphate adenosyltransferase
VDKNMDLIKQFLQKNNANKTTINIIGDSMFDMYYDVSVNRISPEFPIPVYKSQSEMPDSGVIPGGAANVAMQFKHFNVNINYISLISSYAKIIFESNGINTNYCKIVDGMLIPSKKRIFAENIPLVRWDIEKESFGLDDIKKHLMDLTIPNSDLNLFSDYNKGVFATPWFRKFFKNTKSIVDPKNANIDLWEDCDVFKPNSIEAKFLSNKKNWQDQIEFFTNSIRCKSVVITQGGSGVVGKDTDFFEYKPQDKGVAVESVIGAGDCFITFLSMAIAHGFSLADSCEIAYKAGSLYVQRKLNKPISPAELFTLSSDKFVEDPEILVQRNFDLAFTNGCFDFGLTAAHADLLRFAKKQKSKLVIALNSDASVARLKGLDRPILPLEERIKIISAFDCVDYVVAFDEDTPAELLQKIRPDCIVKGGDYKKEDVVGSHLADVILFDYMRVSSTTDKIDKLNRII